MGQDEKSVKTAESGDSWDAKHVDLSDSISAVASGKERNWLDRWHENLEVKNAENDLEAGFVNSK